MDHQKCIQTIRTAVKKSDHPMAPDSDLYQPTSVIALFLFDDDPSLLFIRKADVQGYPWAGQMAFPGGHKDKKDLSTRHTALRELKEELGIHEKNVEVIGSLGHFQTINDKDIEAYVWVWNQKDPLTIDTFEIEKIFKIPLSYLMKLHIEKGFHKLDGPPNVMWLKYPFKDVLIWGVTAKIVFHLLEVLRKTEKGDRRTEIGN